MAEDTHPIPPAAAAAADDDGKRRRVDADDDNPLHHVRACRMEPKTRCFTRALSFSVFLCLSLSFSVFFFFFISSASLFLSTSQTLRLLPRGCCTCAMWQMAPTPPISPPLLPGLGLWGEDEDEDNKRREGKKMREREIFPFSLAVFLLLVWLLLHPSHSSFLSSSFFFIFNVIQYSMQLHCDDATPATSSYRIPGAEFVKGFFSFFVAADCILHVLLPSFDNLFFLASPPLLSSFLFSPFIIIILNIYTRWRSYLRPKSVSHLQRCALHCPTFFSPFFLFSFFLSPFS